MSAMKLTDDEAEKIARKLCELRGQNPDEVCFDGAVGFTPSLRGFLMWEIAQVEVLKMVDVLVAIACVKGL